MATTHRRLMLLLVCVSLVFFTTCRSAMDVEPADVCPNGNQNPATPRVCIDDSDLKNLRAMPDPIPANRGATIHWVTKSGAGNLSIVFDDDGATENITCVPGKGHCFTTTALSAEYKDYKYAVVMSSGKKVHSLDPTLTIKP